VSFFLPPSNPITLYIDADACPVRRPGWGDLPWKRGRPFATMRRRQSGKPFHAQDCCGAFIAHGRFAPGMAQADDAAAQHKHKHAVARACSFAHCVYREGEFCSLACSGGACTTQTCHNGRWVIPPATCVPGFGCPRSC
jgi:hypothetical protein